MVRSYLVVGPTLAASPARDITLLADSLLLALVLQELPVDDNVMHTRENGEKDNGWH